MAGSQQHAIARQSHLYVVETYYQHKSYWLGIFLDMARKMSEMSSKTIAAESWASSIVKTQYQ
jgi:hypothetical protein